MATNQFDIWKMLAGIAFLLLAMNFMEEALKLLAGRRFKLFLKKQTNNKVKAIGGAAIVTGLLQSSSIVNLMVLNMVGAGVVKMENALALIMGSNLGTTFDSWIVAIFGFNYDIENLVLPIVAITGIGMAFLNTDSRWYLWFKFLFSIAFLFVALGFIKGGMEAYVKQTDLSAYNRFPIIIFLLVGMALTAIIQSSSATIVLTLSALHTNAITLYAGMAIVLGSEIGTTFKLFLVSAKGISAKKRVALANFIFNVLAVGIMFVLLKPVYYFINNILKISDNLIALVFFQTFLNISSILLFYPFLNVFGKFLTKRFHDDEGIAEFLGKVSVSKTENALHALQNETMQYINYVIDYGLSSFKMADNVILPFQNQIFSKKTIDQKYEFIKHLHGEMHGFSLDLQNTQLENSQTERLFKIISANRNFMYSAKNIRDAQHDIVAFRNSSNNIKYAFYQQSREKLLAFYTQVINILAKENKESQFEDLTELHQIISTGYPKALQQLYKENLANRVTEVEISTLINYNRELYTSFKCIVYGLKDLLLSPKEANYFDTLPGFIR